MKKTKKLNAKSCLFSNFFIDFKFKSKIIEILNFDCD